MAKKQLLIIGVILISSILCASPALSISVNSAESTGYTGFLGTDSWTRHSKADLKTGIAFNENWSCFLSVGADFSEELKSFTSFSSLSDSFAVRFGAGGKYSKDVFAFSLCGGLKITDMEMDQLNKYADVFIDLICSAGVFNYSGFTLSFDLPLSVSFNGLGCSVDVGIGTSLVYRVDFRGRT